MSPKNRLCEIFIRTTEEVGSAPRKPAKPLKKRNRFGEHPIARVSQEKRRALLTLT